MAEKKPKQTTKPAAETGAERTVRAKAPAKAPAPAPEPEVIDEAHVEEDQPIFDDEATDVEDVDLPEIPFEADAQAERERAADQGAELADDEQPDDEPKKPRARNLCYHAVLRSGLVIQSYTKGDFQRRLADVDPNELLIVLKGNELKPEIKTVQTVSF